MSLSLPIGGDAQTRQRPFTTPHWNLRLAPRQKDYSTASKGVRGSRWFRFIHSFRPLMLAVASLSNPDISDAQTNCNGPWNTVTSWLGTYNLTLTGSGPYESGMMQVNNSSQGSFVLTNNPGATSLAGTLNGTGTVDISASSPCNPGSARSQDTCTTSGSGPLTGAAYVLLQIDTNNCTYQIGFMDPITCSVEEIDCGGGTFQTSEDVPASGDLASDSGFGVLPGFPLPGFGEALTESGGSFSGTSASTVCAQVGSFTLTISWNIQPEISGGTNSLPLLEIIRSGTNIVLFWPTNTAAYGLQSDTNLTATNAWSNVTNVPVVAGGTNYVTNSIKGSTLFYRLIH